MSNLQQAFEFFVPLPLLHASWSLSPTKTRAMMKVLIFHRVAIMVDTN